MEIQENNSSLSEYKGSGTSVITLTVKSGGQLGPSSRLLTDEYGTSSNIKSRVNRQSVQTAILSAQHKLKQYHTVPPNGLCIFCGIVKTTSGKGTEKEKKMNIGFEPPFPINVSMYHCDDHFNLEIFAMLYNIFKKQLISIQMILFV